MASLRSFIAVLFTSLWGWGSLVAAIEAPTYELKIITEDWAPYNYQENGQISGFSVEIVQAMMHQLGETHTITVYPGARGESMLDHQANIMNFSLFRTPERENRYKWIGPISQESIYFYKRKDDQRIFKSISDIKKVAKIAIPHKGLVSSYVDTLKLANIHKMPQKDAQFRHVLMGRADLLANVTPLGISYYLKQLNVDPDALLKTQLKLLEFPLYIACSKQMPDDIINRWQSALDQVKASGEFDRIYNKYLH